MKATCMKIMVHLRFMDDFKVKEEALDEVGVRSYTIIVVKLEICMRLSESHSPFMSVS